MHARVTGWMDRSAVDGWMDGGRWMKDGWMKECWMDEWVKGYMDGWMGRWIDG